MNEEKYEKRDFHCQSFKTISIKQFSESQNGTTLEVDFFWFFQKVCFYLRKGHNIFEAFLKFSPVWAF
jgi:hypothetical protein